VDEGTVYVRLVPRAERRRHQEEVSTELRRELTRLTGVTASISTGSFGDQKQIQLQLRGPDTRELARLADRVAADVRQVPGAVDVGLSTKGQKPELEVRIDRALAGSLGVTVGQVAQALRPAFAGVDTGDWVDPVGETRDVTVRLAARARKNPNDLAALPILVQGPQGGSVSVPLGQIATIESGLGPARIDHLDRDRVISVQANTEGRALSEVMGAITARLGRFELPAGYTISYGGETEDQQEVFGRILTALAVAILLMYLVLVIQFESFLDPLAILLSLPLSLIGVMLALLVTGSTLNIMSMIGVILLMGIVAKNAILLIDFAKWSEEAGITRHQAIVEAGRVRLRPILMTTFALIAGMVPVGLGFGEGADFRAPLGRAVIGGVLTSTLLTLLVIPTIYDILAEGRDRLMARIRRPARAAHAPGMAPAPLRTEPERSKG
jgi:HAE1 family hydrophobic/amphiphilic exporter-1